MLIVIESRVQINVIASVTGYTDVVWRKRQRNVDYLGGYHMIWYDDGGRWWWYWMKWITETTKLCNCFWFIKTETI